MAGIRTAPAVSGTPNWKVVSVTLYDYTGEQRTDSYYFDADSTDAEIEAFVDALQDVSNATIWKVGVTFLYNSVGDSSNAIEAVWEDNDTNVVLLAKSPTVVKGDDFYIPAPIHAMFVEGTNEVDPTNTELAAFLASILPMRAGYSFVSARLTSRRDIGTKIVF